MDKEKISEIVNDLYLFYRVFVSSHFSENLPSPHIKKISRELMRLYEGNDESYKRLCVAMPPRHKLSHDTPILTSEGWKKHGDLKIGDKVFNHKGKLTKIIGVSDESMCDRLITFSNGAKILSHENHLWTVHKIGNKNIKTIPTSQIEKDIYHIGSDGKKKYKYHLPLIEPINYQNDETLPIDPYWLGYWLGDGSSTKPCITHSKEDSQFIDVVPYEVSKQHIHKDTGVYTTYFSNQGLLTELKKLNLYNNKHIPKIYLESSIENRKKLLAGLIDSDGSVDKNGRVRFVNINKNLIDDYYNLCASLSLYPYYHSPVSPQKSNSYKKKNSKYGHIQSKHISYCVGFQPRFELPTQIPRKKVIEKGIRRKIAITNIEKVEGKLGKCIEIEDKEGIYLVGKELIPTHNSKSSLITLSFPMWLIFHNPNLDILIITNSGSLSEKFGIQLREYIDEYGKYFNTYLSDVKKSSSYLMFCDESGKLYNGSIRLVGKGGSITGTNADVLIIDDPYKGLEEEFTSTALEKMNNYYDTIIEQRIEPHTIEVILHTRWRNHDLQGYLKENDAESYKFLEFPAILDDGTPLWKERYTIEELEKKRERMGVRMFNAIYQQTPMDEDSDFFDLTKLKTGKPNANLIGKCRAWDIAGSTDEKGDANDYSVGALMELYDDNSVCITDIVRGQFGTYVKEIIKETAMSDGIDTHVVIETGVAGAGKLLYAEYKEQLRGFIVEQALPVKSKEDRATPFKNAMLDGLVYIDVGDEVKKTFKLELGGFPFSIHDDQVDAVSHGFNYLCRMDRGITPDLQFIDLF